MAGLKPPTRTVSFSDIQRSNPSARFGDQLDVQIQNLIEAIQSTQQALADIRRDDGRLRNRSVAPEQLAPETVATFTRGVVHATEANATIAAHAAAHATSAIDATRMYADNAEAAAVTASQFLTAVNAANELIENNTHKTINATAIVDSHATDAENWANSAKAHAQNSEAQQEQSAAWAEYLAGPVVDGEKAPAYIAGTPWGHGLYYQPVEGYGGVAGLWSAKWWAIYAAQLVGPWGLYYLGGWETPPVPGGINPGTGVSVPNPLAPGSFYYDITDGTIYVWNGSEWKSPYSLASGITSKFVYQTTAGQTVFTGPDMNGAEPDLGLSPSDVHLNGVRLVEGIDYTVDNPTSTLTLTEIVPPAGAILQWDLLVPPDDLVPGNVNSFKLILAPTKPDGVITEFLLSYPHPIYGVMPANITDGSQLQVSIDGIIQEPGIDYVASGDTLTFAAAPTATARLWAVWFSNAVLTR
jgi:hypothetical protein